jgi:hypothetical protein
MKRNNGVWLVLVILAFGLGRFNAALAQEQESKLIRQTQEEADRKSKGCLTCHAKIENPNMHQSTAIKLGCTDCHGGNAEATTVKAGHVKPRFEDKWKTSANPVSSYTLLNEESPEFLKFVNPGDLRAADETCGPCHAKQVLEVKKSMMTTSALLWGGAAYNNGIVSTKNYILGESYSRDGFPQQINTVPAPTADAMKYKGILPTLFPLPRWEITQPGDYYRSFERGGKVFRGNPSEIGIPNPFEEPGKPDNKLSDRGKGTQLLISSPVLNIHKTRLNDPHLSFMGTNDHPGDYRSSGCTACHVVYANDRSFVHSGPYAKFGNRGQSQTADTTISKTESGHPLKHVFTTSIPSSQCMVCHMHQPNAFMNTYFGYQMWDYETDGEGMYPEKQKYPSNAEAFKLLASNPEEAVLRGKWGDYEFLAKVSEANPARKNSQFSDYHGHGWVFRAVFNKDRKGNLLDKDGKIVPPESEHKFHGVVPLEDPDKGFCNDECRQAQKAVHLKDIHAEKGMHCVDCHFSRDNHGTGQLVGEFHNAVEIQCVDCHGTITERTSLRTSGIAAPPGGTNLAELNTPFGDRRFLKRGTRIFQRSMVFDTLRWEIPQVADIIDPNSPRYNSKARLAKLMGKSGEVTQASNTAQLAHANEKMECYTCHTSWITNCFGCHLPQQANWKKDMNHYEGETSRNWTTYNPQVLRDEGFMLCVNATTKGNKVAPARSSSALILSSKNANREQIYLQQPPISAPGYSSQAFNPHFPHTVRAKETRVCTDCHLSSKNDNNAWMAQTLLQGTNLVNFIGKYAYVGMGKHGFEAVQVTVDEEPQAVIGSYLHKLAYPDYYKKHEQAGKKLKIAYHHGGTNILSVQLRGEYLYTANGPDGFRVYDVANVDNKGFSERLVTAPVSPFGQDTQVKTKYATAVALPTNMPVDTKRVYRPENQEQWPIHPSYSYAYITDKYEGLVIVDVMTLVDGDPRNNFLKRALTFNPSGVLNGAVNLAIAGNYAYILCDVGLVVVRIAEPLQPKVVGGIKSPEIKMPKAIAIQFRYAFICDEAGVKVVDITTPEKPRFVPNNVVKLAESHDIYVARTYAYVAAGKQGLAILDVENPEAMKLDQMFTAGGAMNDVRGVKVAATNASVFAYVADGKNGLRVLQLTSPGDTPTYLGFSPRPNPKLIATHKGHGEAITVSKGLDRDRAVDESGNQVSIFGRLGSRPLTLAEQQRLYWKNGKIWTVSDDGKVNMEQGGNGRAMGSK